MKSLALAFLLASPALADAPAASTATLLSGSTVQPLTPTPGSVESSKIRLDSQDAAGALADAEAALAHGGGADAYAARADAKRALGRPLAEALADYAEAAKLDPRYIEKYNGLIAQQESEEHPNKKQTGGGGLNGVPIAGLLGAASIGGLCIGIAVIMLNARKTNIVAPDDEDVKSGGRENGVGQNPAPPDGEQPPGKEPPKA